MADIKQAAKWMDEGKRVRRPYLAKSLSLGNEITFKQWIVVYIGKRVRRSHGNTEAPFSTDDLLADDWEVAE